MYDKQQKFVELSGTIYVYWFRKAVVKSDPKFKDPNNTFQVILKESSLSEDNFTLLF
jgi:hypothetical protein